MPLLSLPLAPRLSPPRTDLKGWFFIDALSVAPFFLITLDMSDPWGDIPAADGDAGGTASITRATVLFRIVKLLRMLKLARIFRASRVFERTVLDVALHHLEWTYAVLKLLKFFLWLVIFAHFQACVWGLVSSFLPPPTWISEFEIEYMESEGEGERLPSGLEVYAAALYWSVMTLTSIGYGAMTPVNTTERWLCSLYMMLSGIIWTYAIGSVAAIATTLNPNQVLYETTSRFAGLDPASTHLRAAAASPYACFLPCVPPLLLTRTYTSPDRHPLSSAVDQLNFFMRERDLPREMRHDLREFFKASRRIHQLSDDSDLLSKLTPQLQSTVALAYNRDWIGRVYFLRGLFDSREGLFFIADLAKTLAIRNFVSKERLPVGQLYIVRKGLVVRMWRFLGARKCWGEDFIIERQELMDHSQAVALAYLEVYVLRRRALDALLEEHPVAQHVVSKAARKISMQRALLLYLARANFEAATTAADSSSSSSATGGGPPSPGTVAKLHRVFKGPRSFILKSQASDPDIADDPPTMEDTVDATARKLDGVERALDAIRTREERADAEIAELKAMVRTLVDRK